MAIPGLVYVGTCTWAQGLLNQGMVTRTPNGDLYASCGDMGQNHDLDTSAGHPINIWYSNDDGATWVESKEIYVDGFVFGGGGNGVCIASDSAGLVHVAFGVRRHGVSPETFKSRNIVFYLHGKHGDWGAKYNIFQLDLVGYPLDCLPRVSALEVDSNDLAHILYSQAWDNDYKFLWHLWDSGTGTFSNTIIATDIHWSLGGRNRLVIDGNDTVHVVYGDVSQEKYYHKCKAVAGGWGASVWIGMGSWLNQQAIAVDKDNTLHLAIFDGAKGYYRQRSPAGVWSDIEEWIGTWYGNPSISISQDGTVYIIDAKAWYYLIIRKRDPSTGTWSTDELWDVPGAPCMLHSFFPIFHGNHPCILDTGWVFNISIGSNYKYYYKAGGVFGGGEPGFIWSEGEKLHYIDENGVERAYLGDDLGVHGQLGHLWPEGNDLHYIAELGHERHQQGTPGTASGIGGALWVEEADLHYGDENGDERYLGGTWILGTSKLGVDTVT